MSIEKVLREQANEKTGEELSGAHDVIHRKPSSRKKGEKKVNLTKINYITKQVKLCNRATYALLAGTIISFGILVYLAVDQRDLLYL